jgi:hypothetical protein
MSEGFISRGFRGRRQESELSGRLPPGQYLERGFPRPFGWANTAYETFELGFFHCWGGRATETLELGRVSRSPT